MKLFDIVIEESKLHPNFKSIMDPIRSNERALLLEWASGFIDRDNKLIKEFQTTFNSTFWEIYLYRVFVELGLEIDWQHAAPDFSLSNKSCSFVVEATTANAANGKPCEWEKTFSMEELAELKRFSKINHESIIRLSNALISKERKYAKSYSKQAHVIGKPFVLAIAPFEQPYFNHQYTRPINAVLYDIYVDEDAYLDNPKKFPYGPPNVSLGFVEKDNGAEIALGMFTTPEMENVSAVIFSCTATWGKLSAMSHTELANTKVLSVWSKNDDGIPVKRICSNYEHNETIFDGLQVFHNPFAKTPLPKEVFNKKGIVQSTFDIEGHSLVREGLDGALYFRQTITIPKKPYNKAFKADSQR